MTSTIGSSRSGDALSVLAVLVSGLVPPRHGLAQEVTTVPDPVACDACSIHLDSVTILGAPNDFALLRTTSHVAVDSEGNAFVAGTYEPGRIVMYSGSGEYVKAIGREGEGPGEFGARISDIVVGPGDSIHVFETTRHTTITPGLGEVAHVRRLDVPAWAAHILDDGRVLANYPLYTGGERVDPLHVLDGSGAVVHALSVLDEPIDYLSESDAALRVSAAARSGRVWSSTTGWIRW